MKVYKIKIPLQIFSVSEMVYPKMDSSDRGKYYDEVHEEDAYLSIVVKARSSSDALSKFVEQFTKSLKVGAELG